METATPLCQYASKPCHAPRSVKDSGVLHRLCEFHRAKANDAQRRWHARQQSGEPAPLRAKRTTPAPSMQRRRCPRTYQPTALYNVFDRTRSMPSVDAVPGFGPASATDDLLSEQDMALLDAFFDEIDVSILESDAPMGDDGAQAVFPDEWWKELQSLPATAL